MILFNHCHVIPQHTVIPVLICICLPPPHPGFSFLNIKPVRHLRACLEHSVWRDRILKGKQGETADPFNFQNTRIIPSLTVSMHKVFHCTYM